MFEKMKAAVAENRKTVATSIAMGSTFVAGSANAALDQTIVDGIVAVVTSDIAIALAAGFSILAVKLGGQVGMGLVKSFIMSGAR